MIFDFDSESGRYGVSKLFQEYAFDLRNWTMDPRFFERYGELAHDIPMNLRKAGSASCCGCTPKVSDSNSQGIST